MNDDLFKADLLHFVIILIDVFKYTDILKAKSEFPTYRMQHSITHSPP